MPSVKPEYRCPGSGLPVRNLRRKGKKEVVWYAGSSHPHSAWLCPHCEQQLVPRVDMRLRTHTIPKAQRIKMGIEGPKAVAVASGLCGGCGLDPAMANDYLCKKCRAGNR